MITIFYPEKGHDITGWKERLDRTSLKYEFIIDNNNINAPRLVDGDNHAEGIPAIETYLESQEQFVKDWYEDRCDKYEFDPEAKPVIKGING
ncbi:hypothetical protein [Mucilaginibacter terrae]|uniref:Uncharacterized protein n=1 Tax=Mucilaginibacter terrae TaxID=1955052 RepID=A0ABU3GQW0_9SPHI|nr:hypothetical protein [Mucilaginibacter terrae]MDT3402025.1 hypothetical protein [Mucilaginibacter terrae]